MRVTVNLATCQHMGQCAFEAPAVFRLDDDGRLVHETEVDEGLREQVGLAAELCPTQSITLD